MVQRLIIHHKQKLKNWKVKGINLKIMDYQIQQQQALPLPLTKRIRLLLYTRIR